MKWFKWQSEKDKEIERLKARIAELEEQLENVNKRRTRKKNRKA